MSDERLQVRSKAKKILCGLIHSGFIDPTGQSRLLKDFRTKIRRKMTKKVTGSFKFKKEKPKSLASLDKAELAAYHSGMNKKEVQHFVLNISYTIGIHRECGTVGTGGHRPLHFFGIYRVKISKFCKITFFYLIGLPI